MVIFKTFQCLENFYIKFQDFPYFSRMYTNPVQPLRNDAKRTGKKRSCSVLYRTAVTLPAYTYYRSRMHMSTSEKCDTKVVYQDSNKGQREFNIFTIMYS